jgi:hypothetical protein
MKMDSRVLAFAAMMAAAFVPGVAAAEGEACVRDTECAAAALCIDGACGADDPSVDACTDDDDCDSDEGCFEGFCKHEGAVCRSPAGACWEREGGSTCHCADGTSSQSSDPFNPDDPPEPRTDEELVADCTAELVDACGEDAPMLPESCTGDVLAECEAFVEREDELLLVCDGEEPSEVNIGRVGECCETQDDEAYAAYRACVIELEVGDECPGDAWAACEGDGGELENDGESATDEDEEKAGCRIGAPSAWTLLLLAMMGVSRRRR